MFRSHRTSFWTAGVHIICPTFFTLLQLLVVLSTKYELQETCRDIMCSPAFVESVFHAPSPLTCLVICSTNTTCPMFIHNRESKLCYRLRPDFKTEDCSTKLVGARLFMQEEMRCPEGWTFLYKSCYRIFTTFQTRDVAVAKCNGFGLHAHLADLNTKDENDKVYAWLKVATDIENGFWLGASYGSNGWEWSDGTPMLYQNVIDGTVYNTCLALFTSVPYWDLMNCHWSNYVLCEIDTE